jgi:hypothetical protein
MFPPNTFACAASLKRDPEKWVPFSEKMSIRPAEGTEIRAVSLALERR